MNILSWNFVGFTLIALVVYYYLPRRSQNIWLLACSFFFYAGFGWEPLAILISTIFFNYLVGGWLSRSNPSRILFYLGIGVNLAAILGLKIVTSRYAGIFLSPLQFAGLDPQALLKQIYLPVGFSFYVMQAIAYLADVYQKRLPACKNPVDFALYMAYFPKMVSGPIEKARPFLTILANNRVVDNEALKKSSVLILLGLTRKIVFADLLYRIGAREIFSTPNTGNINPWFGLLAYAFYIYNDFAGYTDIVRGISGLFGIPLSQNFRNPYLSRNFSEFWTRWHITLSTWLKEYIFFPLSRKLLRKVRNPQNLVNLVSPPLVTMLASGLWHGFSLAMLLWGGIHSLYLIIERVLFLRFPSLRPQEQGPWGRRLSTLVTFILVILAWVPFGLNILKPSFSFWASLFRPQSLDASLPATILVMGLIIMTIVIDWVQNKYQDEVIPLQWPAWAQVLILFAVINLFFLAAVFTGFPKLQEFVYRMF